MAGTNFFAQKTSAVDICLTENTGLAVLAKCTGTPPTTANIFAHGCLIIQSDSGTGNKALFENVGSSAVPSWNLLGDVAPGEITLAQGNVLVGNASSVATALDAKTSGRILVGDGTTIASVAVSNDLSLASNGAATIANGAVTNAKVADTTGVGSLAVSKSALVVYDFAVDGGAQGTIALTGSPTIPDNAVVWCDSYEVMTTCTSATDAATITLGVPTDGDLFSAIAISDGSNPWDTGVAVQGLKALTVASQTPVKLTGARTLQLTIAGGENVTAGKIVFRLSYWVGQ